MVRPMKLIQPPGSPVMKAAMPCATPACVIAHAIAMAVPRIIRIAPVSAAVSTNIW